MGFFWGASGFGILPFFSGVFWGPVSPKPASVFTAPVQAVHRLTAPRQGSFRESGTGSLCCSSFAWHRQLHFTFTITARHHQQHHYYTDSRRRRTASCVTRTIVATGKAVQAVMMMMMMMMMMMTWLIHEALILEATYCHGSTCQNDAQPHESADRLDCHQAWVHSYSSVTERSF